MDMEYDGVSSRCVPAAACRTDTLRLSRLRLCVTSVVNPLGHGAFSEGPTFPSLGTRISGVDYHDYISARTHSVTMYLVTRQKECPAIVQKHSNPGAAFGFISTEVLTAS